MNAGMIGGRICGMRARRVGHRQTLETAVRGIGARHFHWIGRQELSPWSDENPIYGIAGDKPYAFCTSWAKKENNRNGAGRALW